MADTIRWWLVSSLLGLIGLPYAFRVLRFLPDRGYTAARVLGLLMTVYPLWLLSALGVLPYSGGGATVVLASLALGALVLAGRDRGELIAHLRHYRRLLITAEVVFVLALCGFAALRAYQPAIENTEKLFEFAFFNGVLRSPQMPPADPWYSGEPMSYYYGGYLFVALFTHLTGTTPAVAYNLGIALTAGMTAVGAFGLGANALLAIHAGRWRRLPDRGLGRAARAGAAGVVLLLVIGNLEGALELGAAHGWGSTGFYQRLGIEGLPPPALSREWYPDAFLSWWHATRLASQFNVLEFPFFSFMLGDLHAHVLVLPVSLLGLATLLNLLRSGERLDLRAVRHGPGRVLGLGLLAGMLGLTNSWDQPIFLGLLFAAALMLNVEREGVTWRALLHTIAFVAPVGLLSFVLYLPFIVYLHPATYGIAPVEINNLDGLPRESMVFPPHHFFIYWGPLLLVGGGAIVGQVVRRRAWRANSDTWGLAVLIALLPLLLWMAAITGAHRNLTAVAAEIGERAAAWSLGSYWLVQLGVVTLIALGLVGLLYEAGRQHPQRRAGRVYVILTCTVALALMHIVELFYVREPGPGRLNTLFKFSYLAWLLLATAGGAALLDLLLGWRAAGRARPALVAWGTLTGVTLVLALIYPVVMPFNFTNGFAEPPTLDGLAALRRQEPDEYEAVRWLADTLVGRPLILEAVGSDYSRYGRVSARTGFPTVLGWPFHEAQERGGKNFLESGWARLAWLLQLRARPPSGEQLYERQAAAGGLRERDVETIYRTTDAAEARMLLQRYGVDFVYFGRLEAEKYGVEGLDKFAAIGRAVYRRGSVIIYRVRGVEPPLGRTR